MYNISYPVFLLISYIFKSLCEEIYREIYLYHRTNKIERKQTLYNIKQRRNRFYVKDTKNIE